MKEKQEEPKQEQSTKIQGDRGMSFPAIETIHSNTQLPLQRKEASENASRIEKPPLQMKSENKTGLPENLKTGIENLSGYSMDDVRVHRNSNKPAQLRAYAYAQGTDIHLGPGQEKHLPHEAWHVVQQKQGRVKPTLQMKTGHLVNDNEGLEREADVMGERVMQFNTVKSSEHLLVVKENLMNTNLIQGKFNRIRGSGNISGSVEYETKENNGLTSSYRMSAKNIKLKEGKNSLAADDEPSVDVPGWSDIRDEKLTSGGTNMVRMHLLNGKLGGHGSKMENLAPGSKDLNSAHKNKVEKHLQSFVKKGKTIVSYDVFAYYRTNPLDRFSKKSADLYKHTLLGMHCQYKISSGEEDSLQISEGKGTAKAWPSKLSGE